MFIAADIDGFQVSVNPGFWSLIIISDRLCFLIFVAQLASARKHVADKTLTEFFVNPFQMQSVFSLNDVNFCARSTRFYRFPRDLAQISWPAHRKSLIALILNNKTDYKGNYKHLNRPLPYSLAIIPGQYSAVKVKTRLLFLSSAKSESFYVCRFGKKSFSLLFTFVCSCGCYFLFHLGLIMNITEMGIEEVK